MSLGAPSREPHAVDNKTLTDLSVATAIAVQTLLARKDESCSQDLQHILQIKNEAALHRLCI